MCLKLKKVAKQLRHVEILGDETYTRQPYVIVIVTLVVLALGNTDLIFELVNQLDLPVIQLTACVAT